MAAQGQLKCLIVDDSAVYRKIVRNVVQSIPNAEVVGMARDGKVALDMIASHKPDVVTLDLEMPELDGIGVLRELQARGDKTAAIMVSAFTARGAKATATALRLGAFDFILKPTTKSAEMSIQQLSKDLSPKLLAIHGNLQKSQPGKRVATPSVRKQVSRPAPKRAGVWLRPEIVAIGVSTGGPQALSRLMPKIPANFSAPIVIVQHMPPMFTKSLAEELDKHCPLKVMEASNGQVIRRGEVLLAPGGKQMRIAKGASGNIVQLTDDAPEKNCKPSVDYLFRSVAQVYRNKSVGVVLTGMGDDGTLGAQQMRQAGAGIIAQDEASCTVYGMPKSVVENGLADVVAPLDKIHEHIVKSLQQRLAV